MALAGNKNDMYEHEEIEEEEGKKLAKELGAIFQKTSAKESTGVEDLFVKIGKKFINPNKEDSSNLTKEERKQHGEKLKRDKIKSEKEKDSVNQLNKVESNLLDNIKKENRRIDLIGEENINTETNEVLDVIENDRLFDKVNDNSSEEIIFDEANDSINNNLFENKDVINEKNEDSIDVDNSYNVSDSELLDLLDNKLNVNSSTLNESEILDLSENEILNMNQENVLNNDSSNSVNEILF